GRVAENDHFVLVVAEDRLLGDLLLQAIVFRAPRKPGDLPPAHLLRRGEDVKGYDRRLGWVAPAAAGRVVEEHDHVLGRRGEEPIDLLWRLCGGVGCEERRRNRGHGESAQMHWHRAPHWFVTVTTALKESGPFSGP